MKIDAIFFDIDGTLVDIYTRQIPDSTFEALRQLREKGIKLFICSGRHPSYREQLDKELKFTFDGYIFMNGQWITDINGNCLTSTSFDENTKKELYDYFENNPDLYINVFDEKDMFANKVSPNKLVTTPVGDIKKMLKNNIYQLMVFGDRTQDEKLEKEIKGCKSARWNEWFADIIPSCGGKDKGIENTLKLFNINKENTMAFGDGGNDIPMFKAVNISVAMGNGDDYVKQNAKMITDNCIDGGIYNALKKCEVL